MDTLLDLALAPAARWRTVGGPRGRGRGSQREPRPSHAVTPRVDFHSRQHTHNLFPPPPAGVYRPPLALLPPRPRKATHTMFHPGLVAACLPRRNQIMYFAWSKHCTRVVRWGEATAHRDARWLRRAAFDSPLASSRARPSQPKTKEPALPRALKRWRCDDASSEACIDTALPGRCSGSL